MFSLVSVPHDELVKRAEWIGGAGAAALAAAAPEKAFGQKMREIVFAGLGPSGLSWPYMLFDELGLSKRYGINVVNVSIQSTAAGAQLLIAKGCDVVDLSVTQAVEVVQGGADVKMYSNTVSSPPYALMSAPSCKKCSDIRGKSICVGGVNDFTRIFAERILQAGGVMPNEYEETYAGATTDRYAALRSGSVAAAIVFPPWDFRAIDDGFNVLGRVPDAMPFFPYDGLSARSEFTKANPDLMLDFMKMYLHALRWLYDPANKAKAVDALTSQTKTSPGDAGRTYDLVFTKYRSFTPDGKFTVKGVNVVIEMLAQLKTLQPPLPSASIFFDNHFVTQAGLAKDV
jgi:NitT/TauT family transport system substrate-binding protein